jgi:uncharacterized membrane protein YfcA
MDLTPRSSGRMIVALVILALAAATVPFTIDDDKYRKLVFIVLAFFAFRVILTGRRSR